MRTERGYRAEVAIPIEHVIERQGGALESVRVNIGVNDSDGRGAADRVWWRPEWGSPADYVESGVFRVR